MHWRLNFLSSVHIPLSPKWPWPRAPGHPWEQGGLGPHSWVRNSVVVDPTVVRGVILTLTGMLRNRFKCQGLQDASLEERRISV